MTRREKAGKKVVRMETEQTESTIFKVKENSVVRTNWKAGRFQPPLDS